MVEQPRAPRREIRDRDGEVLWRSGDTTSRRSGVILHRSANRSTTATGLEPGDQLYEDGVLVYIQEDV